MPPVGGNNCPVPLDASRWAETFDPVGEYTLADAIYDFGDLPGKPSEVGWKKAADLASPGREGVWFSRESDNEQDRQGRLDDQTWNGVREAEALGFDVVGRYQVCVSGKPGNDRSELTKAYEHARRIGAVLLVESPSRLERHPEYGKENQDVQPTLGQWLKHVNGIGKGVQIGTLTDPDASPSEERAYQTRRGLKAKEQRPQRPKTYANAERERVLPVARRMKRNGRSTRQIAADLGVPEGTLRRWLKRRRKVRAKLTHP